MKTFIIDVSRVSYSDKTYRINAENMQEATDKALELAYNEVFNEKSSEYVIDYAEEVTEENQ